MADSAAPRDPRLDVAPRPRPEPLWRELLGGRLRELREGRGERLVDTAKRAGVSPQYLSEVERGLKDPSSEMVAAILGALEASLGDVTLDLASSLLVDALPEPAGWGADPGTPAPPSGGVVLAA